MQTLHESCLFLQHMVRKRAVRLHALQVDLATNGTTDGDSLFHVVVPIDTALDGALKNIRSTINTTPLGSDGKGWKIVVDKVSCIIDARETTVSEVAELVFVLQEAAESKALVSSPRSPSNPFPAENAAIHINENDLGVAAKRHQVWFYPLVTFVAILVILTIIVEVSTITKGDTFKGANGYEHAIPLVLLCIGCTVASKMLTAKLPDSNNSNSSDRRLTTRKNGDAQNPTNPLEGGPHSQQSLESESDNEDGDVPLHTNPSAVKPPPTDVSGTQMTSPAASYGSQHLMGSTSTKSLVARSYIPLQPLNRSSIDPNSIHLASFDNSNTINMSIPPPNTTQLSTGNAGIILGAQDSMNSSRPGESLKQSKASITSTTLATDGIRSRQPKDVGGAMMLKIVRPNEEQDSFTISPAAFYLQFFMLGIDKNLKVNLWSTAAATATGLGNDDVIGKDVALLFSHPGIQRDLLTKLIDRLRQRGGKHVVSETIQLQLISSVSGSISVNCVATALRDARGARVGFVFVGHVEHNVESSGNVFISRYRSAELVARLQRSGEHERYSTSMNSGVAGDLILRSPGPEDSGVARKESHATMISDDSFSAPVPRTKLKSDVGDVGWLARASNWDFIASVAGNLAHWIPYAPTQLLSHALQPHMAVVDLVLDPDLPPTIPANRHTLDILLRNVLSSLVNCPPENGQKCQLRLYRRHPHGTRTINQVVIELKHIDVQDAAEIINQEDCQILLHNLIGTFEAINDETCTITFPLVDKIASDSSLQDALVDPDEPRPEKVLTILVYEPGAVCRQHTIRAIWKLGHAAIAAENLEQLQTVLRTGGNDLHCAIVSSGPGISKAEHVQVLNTLEAYSDIVVLHSGDDNTASKRYKLPRPAFVEALQKPVQMVVSKWLTRQRQQIASEERRQIFSRHNSSPWRQGKKLGRGAHADVYEAHTTLTGGVMAVKMIWVQDWDASRVQQLMNEIDLLSQLQHPNIVHYFYCERGEQTVNLFMELCDCTIKEHARSTYKGTMPPEVAARSLREILEAISFIHEKGIIHRDIKAKNVLVSHGRVKIADFGTATLFNENEGSSSRNEEIASASSSIGSEAAVTLNTKRVSTGFVGTLRYMAPEVLRGESVSFAVDIWCIGLLALELICDYVPKMPYSSEDNVEETLSKLMLPNDVRDFIMACLQVDPTKRSSAQTLLAHPFIVDATELQSTLPSFEAVAVDRSY